MISKKNIFILFVLLALMLAACSSGTETTAPAEPEVAAETGAEAVVEAPAVEEAAEPVAEAAPEVEEAAEPAAEAEEPEPVEEIMVEPDLDGSYQVFLADMQGYNTIGLDALNEMMVEQDVFLLDVREPAELEANGWIEGAVNIPLRQVADNVAYLPAMDETIVSYCGSGWRCTIALAALEAMGWENVLGLKGGSFGGWIEAGYPYAEGEIPGLVELHAAEPDPAILGAMQDMLHEVPEGFGVVKAEDLNADLAENPDLILIDVRRPEEVEEKGYIDAPNVLFIPLEEFIKNKDQWPADLDAPIVTTCGSGHRSTIAMPILWSYGFTDVRSLKDGYGGWTEGGFPTIGAPEPAAAAFDLDAAYTHFLADMEKYNTIGLDDLNLMLAEDPPPFILDVRQPAELEEKGYIEGAVNIPIREVADNLELLPDFDTTIVSYCGSGWRCTIVLTTLEALGWENVLGLKGGSFGGWVEAGYPYAEGLPAEAMVLDVAQPDPAGVELMQAMLHDVPEGYGVITAEQLNLELVENPDLIVIDVRRTEELEEKGVIEAKNWMHIPLEEFIAQKDQWPQDMTAPIVIYCGSGHRSTIAMAMMWSYGYEDVHSLKGGFSNWAEEGYPVAEMATP